MILYYITARNAFAYDEPTRRRRLLEKIAEAARAGVDYIQLREKDLSTRELESLADEARDILNGLRTEDRKLRTYLLINSRTDVALACGADGVHLRSEDVSPQEVRAIWESTGSSTVTPRPPHRTRHSLAEDFVRTPLIGVSCHSPAEVGVAAANGASFAVFGPVFEKGPEQPVGLGALGEACRFDIPVLALGGVTIENACACLEAGAAGVAGIRLFQVNDIGKIVRQLRSHPRGALSSPDCKE